MGKTHDRGRLDWLVEIMGATAPAAAAAFAAAKLAPVNGWSLSTAVLVGFGGMFAAAFTAMRIVPAEARQLALPDFESALMQDEELIDHVLLLDQAWIENGVEAATEAVAELLLDDPLAAPMPDSRVVQLFAEGRIPTAGQLKHRIDRHLADGARPTTAIDAADTLSEALAELRRSLRQA